MHCVKSSYTTYAEREGMLLYLRWWSLRWLAKTWFIQCDSMMGSLWNIGCKYVNKWIWMQDTITLWSCRYLHFLLFTSTDQFNHVFPVSLWSPDTRSRGQSSLLFSLANGNKHANIYFSTILRCQAKNCSFFLTLFRTQFVFFYAQHLTSIITSIMIMRLHHFFRSACKDSCWWMKHILHNQH